MQWWTETNKNICYKVLLNKSVNSSLKGLKNISVIPSLKQGLFRQQNPQNKSLFNLQDSSLGCHINAASHKRLEIQAYSITKWKFFITKWRFLLGWKCVQQKYKFLASLKCNESNNLGGSIILYSCDLVASCENQEMIYSTLEIL